MQLSDTDIKFLAMDAKKSHEEVRKGNNAFSNAARREAAGLLLNLCGYHLDHINGVAYKKQVVK